MLFGKSGKTRLAEIKEYLPKIGLGELSLHLHQTMQQAGDPNKIAEDVSLGSDGSKLGNESKRQALRTLLLCQRVYFAQSFARKQFEFDMLAFNYLFPGWKEKSMRAWGALSEDKIVQGIRSFTAPVADAAAVADTATHRKPFNFIPDTVASFEIPVAQGPMYLEGKPICYEAIRLWLFYSGLVSWRWMMKHPGGSKKAQFDSAFGKGTTIWGEDTLFQLNTSHLQHVPKGWIVHIYVDDPSRWLGHWMVSRGDGRGIGCNNGDENGGLAEPTFSKECSLDKQFYHGYKAPAQKTRGAHQQNEIEGQWGALVGEAVPMRGVCTVYNPLEIPGRNDGRI